MNHDALSDFIFRHAKLVVLTGAGCSTDSGIPDYRNEEGDWKRPQPVQFQSFMRDLNTRKRYWARNLIGWQRFSPAKPNTAHHALARLEQQGAVELLVTQNVDRLHQAAGSRHVVDLHGRMDLVRCMDCWRLQPRSELQDELITLNPSWANLQAPTAPDSDADLDGRDFSTFEVPACSYCAGILKPDVVFFGESVPKERVETAMHHLQQADAMLIVGSSLMVYSGYRFAQAAALAGKPIAAVNLGRTRADDLLSLKIRQPCAEALAFLLEDTALCD